MSHFPTSCSHVACVFSGRWMTKRDICWSCGLTEWSYLFQPDWSWINSTAVSEYVEWFFLDTSTWYVDWYRTIRNPVGKLNLSINSRFILWAEERLKTKHLFTWVAPEFPVITTEHEYGSPGLGRRKVKVLLNNGNDSIYTWLQCHSRQALDSFWQWWKSSRWKTLKPRWPCQPPSLNGFSINFRLMINKQLWFWYFDAQNYPILLWLRWQWMITSYGVPAREKSRDGLVPNCAVEDSISGACSQRILNNNQW